MENLYMYIKKCIADKENFTLEISNDFTFPKSLNKLIKRIPSETITVQVGDNGLYMEGDTLIIEGACHNTFWALHPSARTEQPAAQAEIKSICITINKDNITAIAKAEVKTSANHAVEVILTYLPEKDEQPWQLVPAPCANLNMVDCIALAYCFSLPFELPDSIDFFDKHVQVDEDKFKTLFYPNTTYSSYTEFVITVPIHWEPIKGVFVFDSVNIDAVLKTNSLGISLRSRIKVGNVGIDIVICMSTSSRWMVFVQPAEGDIFPGLVDFARWIGGQELDKELGQGLKDTGIETDKLFDAAISSVRATVDLYKMSLAGLYISSVINIGKLYLDVSVDLPALTIDGHLHDDKPLNVCEFLTSIHLPDALVNIVPRELAISKADFYAGLRESKYSLYLGVCNLWKIGPFELKEITLYVAYDNSKIAAEFGGVFSLTEYLTIGLEASYGIEGDGWVFEGGLAYDSKLEIGAVVEMLAQKFGIKSIPEPIRSLKLTELYLIYSTVANKFDFVCEGNFKVDDTDVRMSVNISVSSSKQNDGTDTWHATFDGSLMINSMNFKVVFDTEAFTNNTFIALYYSTSTVKTALHDLVAGVSTQLANIIPPSLVIDLREVKFVFSSFKDKVQNTNKKQFLFGLRLDLLFDLKDIPIVGDMLPKNLEAGISDFQIGFCSASFTADQAKSINLLLPSNQNVLPLPAEGLPKGLIISGNLQVADFKLPVNTGTGTQAITPVYHSSYFTATAELRSAETVVMPADITWFNVNKQVGPLDFRRLGVGYSNDKLSFALDASAKLGIAEMSVMGLNLSTPVSHFDPSVKLDGFSLAVKTDAFKLSGSFFTSTDEEGHNSYYGTASVNIGTFGITLLGGATPKYKSSTPGIADTPASFFIYTNIEIPLGGPIYFNLKGFVGGFGINNKLKLPAINELSDYILIPNTGKAPKQGKTPQSTMLTVLPQMKKYFIPQPGQYWMAAGISFSSFRMINVFGVVTLSLGNNFEIAFIGSATMSIPEATDNAIAYVELDIMASFSLASGIFAVEGILSPASYVFGRFCRISGGFGFYLWVSPPPSQDPRPGDFLVTLGGYHPDFKAPAYYPKISRLSVNFNLGPLHAEGSGYFALTPGLFMAGGELSITYKILMIKAWFNCSVNFIMAWSPFSYEARAHVNVGCSVNLGLFTIKISVGTSLSLWGPPFGGIATVDIGIFAFDIEFGDKKGKAPALLTWKEFKQQFLPEDSPKTEEYKGGTNILKASIQEGLIHTEDNTGWVIDPEKFVIHVGTVIPANQLIIEADKKHHSIPDIWNHEINIKPMGKNDVQSKLAVSVFIDEQGKSVEYVNSFNIQPVIEDAAAALWGKYDGKTNLNGNEFVLSTLSGVKISPMPSNPKTVSSIPILQLIFEQNNIMYFNYEKLAVNPQHKISYLGRESDTLTVNVDGISNVNKNYILSSIVKEEAKRTRDSILKNLAGTGRGTYLEATLSNFAKNTSLRGWPQILKLGDSLK